MTGFAELVTFILHNISIPSLDCVPSELEVLLVSIVSQKLHRYKNAFIIKHVQ